MGGCSGLFTSPRFLTGLRLTDRRHTLTQKTIPLLPLSKPWQIRLHPPFKLPRRTSKTLCWRIPQIYWSGADTLVAIVSEDSSYVLRFDREAYNAALISGDVEIGDHKRTSSGKRLTNPNNNARLLGYWL